MFGELTVHPIKNGFNIGEAVKHFFKHHMILQSWVKGSNSLIIRTAMAVLHAVE